MEEGKADPMATDFRRFDPRSTAPVRMLAEQALSRTAGAPLVPGNQVRLLKDAGEIEAGAEVRVFNAPSLASPLGWMQRDHRAGGC